MRLREVDALLAAANPVPAARADGLARDARARADRERVLAVAPSIAPEARTARRRHRPVSRVVIAAVVAVLLGATAAGAWVAREVLLDLGPRSPGIPLPTHGAPLGTVNGITYYAATGSTPGSRCFVRIGETPASLIRSTACMTGTEFARAGGMIVVDRRLSGSRHYGPYFVAGLLPEGITSVRIRDDRIEVHDGFFAVALRRAPPREIQVSGPGVPAIARGLWPDVRSTFLPSGEAGPSYRILR